MNHTNSIIYILVSRDNVMSSIAENFEPIMDEKYIEFNNHINTTTFFSEKDIVLWIENKNRKKRDYRSNTIKTNKIRKHDEGKYKMSHLETLYGVYKYDKITKEYEYMYSLKKKLILDSKERLNLTNMKIQSNLKKININNAKLPKLDDFKYSSEPIVIMNQLYEGIYPLNMKESQKNDKIIIEYNDYVKNIHEYNKEKHLDTELLIIDDKNTKKNQLVLVNKLKKIEKLLRDISNMVNHIFLPKNNNKRLELIKSIRMLLINNDLDESFKNDLINLIIDPIFFNDEIYQIKYNNQIITWHKFYSDILVKSPLMCSKLFANFIIDFNISYLTKQYQSYENIEKIFNNLKNTLNITVEQPKIQKFKKIRARFI
jgi:hypothetical protein